MPRRPAHPDERKEVMAMDDVDVDVDVRVKNVSITNTSDLKERLG